ncbi:DNA internalization-related competence protein ComEC/Rec2 [Marinobacter caseinilyticus]|uniref:DNA internalization-related competence protein ComEC/Rec2 n=1 Tax=Marinobacter caseinilyticus TaxID=2692195 RepID=UPI00249E4CB8|nr:DNA internalization-related competence protein ComEC/Rec2 [Marinobacter caseinilyticus]
MRARIAAFSCGVILLYCSGPLPPWAGLILTLMALLFLTLTQKKSSISVSSGVFASLVFGALWAGWHIADRQNMSLPAALEGRELSVEGYLCDIPSPGVYRSVRFTFCVTQWFSLPQDTENELPDTLKLAWYGENATLKLPHLMTLAVSLKQPHGAVNPGGFRYETWLFRHGYRATGTVRSMQHAPSVSCSLDCRYHQWRTLLADRLETALGQTDHYPLVEALLIGQRGHMTPDHWRTLQATGTIHLVAISGLHIGLVALGVGIVFRYGLVRLPQHWLSPSTRRAVCYIAVVGGSLLYALAAGFTVPTQRALIMVVVAGWMLFRARQVGIWSGWLMALGLVLLTDPFAPLDRGFWLSFTAVAVLMITFSARLAALHALAGLVVAQCAVFAALWPVLGAMEQAPVAAGWLANLVAIPWVSLVVMPVLMIGVCVLVFMPGLSGLVGEVFDGVVGALWWVLSWLAEAPVPALTGSVTVAVAFAALTLVGLVFPVAGARWGAIGLFLGWLGLSTLAGEAANNRLVSEPELWVWDVGQGLSVMFRHRDQVLLYDSGPATPSGYSAVDTVLKPNLGLLGVRRINTLILSHGDSDHSGGLASLYKNFPVEKTISGEPRRIAASLPERDSSITVQPCRPGHKLHVGDAKVELWQAPREPGKAGNSNDASCVAVVRFRDVMIVLPGDSSRDIERQIPASLTSHASKHRILIAAHHGSDTSSDPLWLDILRPDTVIYSAGYRHRYGHPHPNVVARFAAVGARQLNTAFSGALRLGLSDTGVSITEWRTQAPFWIAPVAEHWKAR